MIETSSSRFERWWGQEGGWRKGGRGGHQGQEVGQSGGEWGGQWKKEQCKVQAWSFKMLLISTQWINIYCMFYLNYYHYLL